MQATVADSLSMASFEQRASAFLIGLHLFPQDYMHRQRGSLGEDKRKPLLEEKWEAERTSEDTCSLRYRRAEGDLLGGRHLVNKIISDHRLRGSKARAAGKTEECRTGRRQDGAGQKWVTCSLLLQRSVLHAVPSPLFPQNLQGLVRNGYSCHQRKNTSRRL